LPGVFLQSFPYEFAMAGQPSRVSAGIFKFAAQGAEIVHEKDAIVVFADDLAERAFVGALIVMPGVGDAIQNLEDSLIDNDAGISWPRLVLAHTRERRLDHKAAPSF
jgi:hypothetical protein